MNKSIIYILCLTITASFNLIQADVSEGNDILDPLRVKSLPTPRLKEEVDKLISSGDPVDTRHKIHIIWELVDRLQKDKNNTDELMKYLEYGLRHNSWDLKYQLDYAKLLKEKGNLKESERRAEIIVTYAENDNLINEACEILKRPKLPSIPTRKALDDKENTIIFVPIGEVDAWLLFDLQKKLKEILKVKVEIQDFNIPAPKYSRDRRDMTIQDIRENLTEQSDSSDIAQLLKEMGISKNDLKDDQIVIKAARKISEMMGGKKAVNSFNQKLEDAIGKDCQWDIDELYSRLVNETEKDKKTKFKFLGICNLDTYTKGANFLFGTASDKGYGVISYKRFSAEFNEEPPNRARLLDRTLKQALSSLGYMYGIERCSIPTCPRTYPNNLKEHDAKGTELCSKCKQAFEEALK